MTSFCLILDPMTSSFSLLIGQLTCNPATYRRFPILSCVPECRKVILHPDSKEEGCIFFSKLYHAICYHLVEAVLSGDTSRDILTDSLAAGKSFLFSLQGTRRFLYLASLPINSVKNYLCKYHYVRCLTW